MGVENPHDIVISLKEVSQGKAHKGKSSSECQIKEHIGQVDEHVLQRHKEISKRRIEVHKSSDHKSEVIHHYPAVLSLISYIAKVQKKYYHEEHGQHPHGCLLGSGYPL